MSMRGWMSYVSVALLFVVCSCSRQEPKGALPQASASDCEARIRFRTPPRDYSAWQKAFGGKEPDATTEAGRQRLYDEKIRLEVSKAAFTNALSGLPFAYTNSSECAFRDIQSRIEEILEGFCRENSAAILGVVGKNPGMINPTRYLLVSQECASRVVERYAVVAARLADLTWIRAGESFAAAEIDNTMFNSLRGMERFCAQSGWEDARKKAQDLFDRYSQERCDSEMSNFCRSHAECEERFRLHYEKLVQQDPRLQKPLSHWYRKHLRCARNILGREPKWSPDFKEK